MACQLTRVPTGSQTSFWTHPEGRAPHTRIQSFWFRIYVQQITLHTSLRPAASWLLYSVGPSPGVSLPPRSCPGFAFPHPADHLFIECRSPAELIHSHKFFSCGC